MAQATSNPFLDGLLALEESPVAAAFAAAAEGGFDGGYFKFDPKLHPRDRIGRFAEVIANLGWSDTAELPNGVFVQKGPLNYVIRGRTGVVGRVNHHDARTAARMALGTV